MDAPRVVEPLTKRQREVLELLLPMIAANDCCGTIVPMMPVEGIAIFDSIVCAHCSTFVVLAATHCEGHKDDQDWARPARRRDVNPKGDDGGRAGVASDWRMGCKTHQNFRAAYAVMIRAGYSFCIAALLGIGNGRLATEANARLKRFCIAHS